MRGNGRGRAVLAGLILAGALLLPRWLAARKRGGPWVTSGGDRPLDANCDGLPAAESGPFRVWWLPPPQSKLRPKGWRAIGEKPTYEAAAALVPLIATDGELVVLPSGVEPVARKAA